MIKIMIVDDMPIFRQYLQEAIDWQAYGFQVVCEAKNGQEALALAQAHDIDIVLSDINMPFMDGLSLTKALMALNPEISVVLITGHSEFEYARKALKLGVADYIVKPFEKEELIVTLLDLKDNLLKTLEYKVTHTSEDEALRTHHLRQLIYAHEKYDQNLLNESALYLNLTGDGTYLAMVIEVDGEAVEPTSSQTALDWQETIGQLVTDALGQDAKAMVFRDYEDRLVSVCHIPTCALEGFEVEGLLHLLDWVRNRLNIQVTIGVGSHVKGYLGLSKSYQEARQALQHRFQTTRAHLIHYQSMSQEARNFGFYSSEINEKLLNLLRQGQKEAVCEVLDHIDQTMAQECVFSTYQHLITMGLISLILSHLVKMGQSITDVYPKGWQPDELMALEVPQAVKHQQIKKLYLDVLNHIERQSDSRAKHVATEVKAYIEHNYHEASFNMDQLTKSLLMNQTYVRKMFKSEWGMTISEYLLKVRMQHAKALIAKGYYKLSTISEMVGYSDSGYFSKCFKRYYGVSPSDYKA